MKNIYLPLIALIPLLFSACQKEPVALVDKTYERPSVDAGTDIAVTLPASVTLSGNAKSYNGPLTAFLWSMISGPNTPVIQTPGNKTTLLSGLMAGTYMFQLMAVDSMGLTGVDTVNVVAAEKPLTTSVISGDTNPKSVFYFVNAVGLDQSGANLKDLSAVAWTVNGDETYGRGAIIFDLSTIPANSKIISAKLLLSSNPTPLNGNLKDANYGVSNAMYISRITASWNFTTPTYATEPTPSATERVSIPHTDQAMLDINADVTSLVSSMMINGNYGFFIQLQNETIYNCRQFCGVIYPDNTKRPKLTVVYQ